MLRLFRFTVKVPEAKDLYRGVVASQDEQSAKVALISHYGPLSCLSYINEVTPSEDSIVYVHKGPVIR